MRLNKEIFLSKKIFFCFTDPAGANSILAFVDYLQKKGAKEGKHFIIYTDENGKYDSEKHSFVVRRNFSYFKLTRFIIDFKPDIIFTATSVNILEHNVRKIARQNKIRSYAFIDHWGPYIERFIFKKEKILPDYILVIDEHAYKEAQKNILLKDKLKIFSNPYKEKVLNYTPSVLKDSLLNRLKCDKYIVFVDEHIRDCDDFIKDKKTGIPEIGYDEYSTLKNLLDVFSNQQLKKFNEICKIIIKIHPISNIKKFDELLKLYPFLNFKIIKEINSLDLLYYSEIVLGMFSNMLLDAHYLKKEVIRIQINQKKELFHFKIKNIALAKSKINLKKLLIPFTYE